MASVPGEEILPLRRSELADELEALRGERARLIRTFVAGSTFLAALVFFDPSAVTVTAVTLAWVLLAAIGWILLGQVRRHLREVECALTALETGGG